MQNMLEIVQNMLDMALLLGIPITSESFEIPMEFLGNSNVILGNSYEFLIIPSDRRPRTQHPGSGSGL